MGREVFINILVDDIERYKEFFQNLGFEFDYDNSTNNQLILNISSTTFVSFKKDISEKSDNKNGIYLSLSANSKQEVIDTCELAFKNGATKIMDPIENDNSFSWKFKDFENYIWEIIFLK